MTSSKTRFAIIGAGVAGVTAGLRLQAAGLACTVFEKSRGVGGRLSTRRAPGGLQFDHGAQYFTARSEAFQQALGDGPWAGSVEHWQSDAVSGNRDAWMVGTPSMKSPLKAATSSLDIRMNTKVDVIEQAEDGWILSGEGMAAQEQFDLVIISAPAPQAEALVPFSNTLMSDLSRIAYEPCWALMVAFEGGVQSAPSSITPDTGAFSWIAQNSSKPHRDQQNETWVAHASPTWSATHLEMDKEDAATALLPKFLQHIDVGDREPSYVSAHRWRYARVATPAGKPFLTDETGTIFVVGDGCLGPRVECAFESGNTAADHILEHLRVYSKILAHEENEPAI